MSTLTRVRTKVGISSAPTGAHLSQRSVTLSEGVGEHPHSAARSDWFPRQYHSLAAISIDPPRAALQRQEAPDEDEKELQTLRNQPALQRAPAPEEDDQLQTKPDAPRVGLEGGPVPPDVESAIQRARGGGQPLDAATQGQMGATLGHDFSAVRVHADAEADALNHQLSARAFTTGRDVFFRQGEYNPGSGSGRDVLAHELTHVVQQSTGRVRGDGSGMTVRPAGDALEQEADDRARRSETSAP